MLLLALTNVQGHGGIPAFNRLLCRAAEEYAAAAGDTLQVLVLMDRPMGPPYRAFSGNRRRFALALLRQLSPRTRLCLGHVNLAPLGVPFRSFGVVAHGTEVWTPLSLARRLALRRARAVGCVSDHTARCVHLVQGVAAERCVRLINSLPAEIPPEDRTKRPEAEMQVLSITRLHPGEPKGIDLVLRALVQVPGVKYTVAGEGDALPGLRALADKLGIADRARFLGRVSDEQREALLRGCDVFALPSSGEGFGIVYLEAMSHGKPCLAARVGGAPEVVLEGVTGLCVPPAVGPVAEALLALQADPGLRRRLGEAGRERMRRHFGYEQFRGRVAAFLDRL